MDETCDECVIRELREETGIDGIIPEQLGVYSTVDRDPRGRVITVAYYALISALNTLPVAGDDAVNAKWFKISDIPPLAFDHDLILKNALTRLNADLLKG